MSNHTQRRRTISGGNTDGDDTGSDSSFEVQVERKRSSIDQSLVDTLVCPTLRDRLRPRQSPFVVTSRYSHGFVSDDDRVSLLATKYASLESAGARSQDSFFLQRRLSELHRSRATPAVEHDSEETKEGERTPLKEEADCPRLLWAIRAGPRSTVYYNPADTTIAVLTCGGLCPGLNDVVRSIVYKASDYGVPEGNILGIRYGFQGFLDRRVKPVPLTPSSVSDIHLHGGTVLGSSRGNADIKGIVKRLDLWGVDMLFVIGGNGGNCAALALHRQCEAAGVLCSVIGVPKSIDNDIQIIDKCFGFDTAVQEAQRALTSAKVEASSAYRGIGLVKLMGRQSGFIAVQASLASGLVDVCLIPEVPFSLDGEEGVVAYLEDVLDKQGHAVVCIAEGAGQDLIQEYDEAGRVKRDPSGNPILKDVGNWLKGELKRQVLDCDVKYIDPSYMIRSVEPIATDRVYCKLLAHGAVHAAFAGYTGVTVGLVNTHYVLLPVYAVVKQPRTVDPNGQLWNRLRASIGQPTFGVHNGSPYARAGGAG